MKSALLSAWIAAGLGLTASVARAEPAECDLICRLQGYLSTDHMAADSAGATSPSAAALAKHRTHAAKATAPKTAKVADKIAAKGDAKPSVAKAVSIAAAPPPPVHDGAIVKPSKHGVATAALSPPEASLPPPPVTPPAKIRRIAHAAPRFVRAPRPVASATLIPGSARLVPAEFQAFGSL